MKRLLDTADAEEVAAYIIAPEIIRQVGADCVDNLGDGESICFMCNDLPTINLVELASVILKHLKKEDPHAGL